MMRADVEDASKRVGLNVHNMLVLITQGLAALGVFLIVTNAITISLGQRLVVVLLFALATAWVYILGSITRSARVYSFLVLAESSKYLNCVLHVDTGIVEGGSGGGSGGCCGGGGGSSSDKLKWPWGDEEQEEIWELQEENGERWFLERRSGRVCWDLPPGAQLATAGWGRNKSLERSRP
jgi:hypothetical protein